MEQENRDYGMLGRDAEMAVKAGLKSAEWYHSALSRKEMKELMKRSDEAAIRDTFVWLGLMLAFAGFAIWLWPSGWAALPLAAYGVLYGSATDSRWHECGHGTAFRTQWMNDVILSHRQLHDHAQSDALALESHPTSYGHADRRARSRNRRDAATRVGQSPAWFRRRA